MLSTIRALVAKDVRLFARDRTALFFAFALPIVLASVMGTALGAAMGGGGGSSGGVQRIGLAVEDRDGTDASRALVEALEAAAGLSVEITDDARRRVADGERAAALVVPAGYGATLDAGEQPSLDLFRDPARQIASQVVVFQLAPVLFERHGAAQGRGMMSGFLDALDFPEDARAAAEAALERSYDEVEALAQGAEPEADTAEEPSDDAGGFDVMQDAPRLLGLEVTDLAPERDDGIPRSAGASHAFSAMAVMMLLFNLVSTAGTLQDERAEGTLDRLRLMPAAGRTVLTGKLIVSMLLAGVQLTVLFLFGAVAFDVPVLEHAPELAVTSLVWAFAASALGLVFATACSTRRQMESISTLAILGMSALGGAWFPREITPAWFQSAGLATPVAWAMDAYHGILWYGKGLLASDATSGVAMKLGVLAVFGALALVVSSALYARRFGSR